MIINEFGFLVPEAKDFASPASCRLIAEEVDRRLQSMLSRISDVDLPEIGLFCPNGDALIAAGSTNFRMSFQQDLGHTTAEIPGNGVNIDFASGVVTPGLFLVGVVAAFTTIPAGMTRIATRLVVQDPIGPKYTQDTFWYTNTEDCGTNSRNEIHHSMTNLLQIRATDAEVFADVTVTGAGNVTLSAAGSSLWFVRLGDIIA